MAMLNFANRIVGQTIKKNLLQNAGALYNSKYVFTKKNCFRFID